MGASLWNRAAFKGGVELSVLGACVACAAGCALFAHSAGAQVYSDRDLFLAETGAQAAPAWPNVGHLPGVGASYHLGGITLSISSPSSGLWVGSGNHPLIGSDWTTLVAGHDIAIDGQENLNIVFATPVRAFGIDFAEPTTATVLYHPCSALCPCANSTFSVALSLGGNAVGTFQFNRPDDVAAFVGVATSAAFDRVEIRELGGSCDDEYFGRIYTLACGVPCCDSIDFNGDGLFPDTADIDDFLSVFSGGPCGTGTCGDVDFNNDGLFPDTADIDSLLSVFSGGPCF